MAGGQGAPAGAASAKWLAPAHPGPTARLLGVLCGLLLLAGCVQTPTGPTRPPAAVQTLLRQATAAQANGDLPRSALLYEQAAAAAPPSPQQAELRLQAAQLYLELNEPSRARALVEQTHGHTLPPSSAALRRIVQARLALAADRGADALAALTPRPAPLPDALHPAWLAVESDARLAAGEPLAAARLRDQRSELLQNPSSRQANRQTLWSALLAIPMQQLVGLIPPVPDRFGGWLELAYFYRTRQLDPQALPAALHAWQQRYPNHPADGTFIETLLATAKRSLQKPKAIALLLPLSGSLAAVGHAVEHGFLAAYYQDPPQQRPSLWVYDVGEAGLDSLSAYQAAVAEGAQVVVGPLTKSALQRLTVLDFAATPILGLNTLPSSTAGIQGLYQFGLAPEDDAFAAAELAWQRGYQTALTLTSDSDWGDRVAQAFQQRFQALGGRVLEQTRYTPEASDFGDPIEALLNLDVGIRRYKQLRLLLQRDLQFQPRRRRDMDCIFVGAFPREARLIRPQIRFHHGVGVPIIATAQAYEGTPQPVTDRDMDGVLLADIPWLIPNPDTVTDDPLSRDRLARLWPENTRDFPRLYALGMDAYRLISMLALLQNDAGAQFKGRTGRLTMDEHGVIHRNLHPAQFVDGLLQPLFIAPNSVARQNSGQPSHD
ncbi:LppC putative lipoprotein [Nitrococcus mobilis Nb-231]|uniref:LppC putative lipoprotein n=1 Tax=Nitrococcus mobilis Nb-231 TaxID=314278 RepID=A4BQJ7_9GAMM|nr:LppC putative lipoprotein [Nitrococcus mobilis Nb-231]